MSLFRERNATTPTASMPARTPSGRADWSMKRDWAMAGEATRVWASTRPARMAAAARTPGRLGLALAASCEVSRGCLQESCPSGFGQENLGLPSNQIAPEGAPDEHPPECPADAPGSSRSCAPGPRGRLGPGGGPRRSRLREDRPQVGGPGRGRRTADRPVVPAAPPAVIGNSILPTYGK